MAATTFDARHSERIDLDPVTENTSSGLAVLLRISRKRGHRDKYKECLLSGRSSLVAELLRFNDDNKMSNVPTG
uniref:Uncharacterized protein n=1 Tax=Vespula pensylvanica TaxID=30213 RepID=A0A834KM24_VESPE|nr:hypothetical protein H0235_013987 [Vespula pensylvanica]